MGGGYVLAFSDRTFAGFFSDELDIDIDHPMSSHTAGCVSVVDEFRVKPHHGDTENTEVAQRNPRTRDFLCKAHTAR
jgi:hypothetical protein